MADEKAGSVVVDISGDYSSLTSDFAQAEMLAKQGGEEIAKAFSSSSGSIDEVGGKVHDLNNRLDEVPPHAHDVESAFERLFERMAEAFAIEEVAEKLKEIVTESLEVSNRLDQATISMTAMSGSAEIATKELEDLEHIADQDAIAFPKLLTAAQRMMAFGFSTEDTNRVLQLAADAAAATGNQFETVAQRLSIMAEEGVVGARQLGVLGINMRDLADAMGVNEAAAKKMFAALDQEDRITALQIAMQKFAGVAEQTAETAGGAWERLKNKIEGAEATFGQMLTAAGMIIVGTIENTSRVLQGEMSAADEATLSAVAHANALKVTAAAAGEAAAQLKEHVKQVQEEAAAQERAKEAAKAAAEEQAKLNASMNRFLNEFKDGGKVLDEFGDTLDKNNKRFEKMNQNLSEIPLTIFEQLAVGLNPLNEGLDEATQYTMQLSKDLAESGVQGTEAWKMMEQSASDAINHMDNAAKTLGITLSSTFKQNQDNAMKAFMTIAADGSSSFNDIARAWKATQAAMQADTLKTESTWNKTVTQIKTGIERDLAGALTDLIFRVSSVGDAFKRLGEDVVKTILDYLIKEGIEALISKLFVAKAATDTINFSDIMSYAAVAFAATFASIAAIPIVGPAMAPAAAAAAYATVAATAPLAFFDKGGYVPEDMPAMIHKGEVVLTEAQVSGRDEIPMLGGGQYGSVVIHVHADRNPERTARELAKLLKTKSPKFSPAS